ncbi:SpoIIE family protein phosphatase [Streptomyces fragilis]|uniref:SpoIIE family protein phosphatase n=1 Tax=Streptomyces fragilis TaxID=67301 RepID=UPI0024DEE72E|nr:SpoIIE family protein phosphatase [Streptomyces fragilis]
MHDTPHGVRLVLGDVRGKGMDAVAAVAVVVGAFREVAERADTIEQASEHMEQAVVRERDRRAVELEQQEGFVTAVFAEFTRDGRSVTIVNHGHPPPLLLEPGARPRLLEPGRSGGPLALSELVGPPRPGPPVPLRPGVTCLLYTSRCV